MKEHGVFIGAAIATLGWAITTYWTPAHRRRMRMVYLGAAICACGAALSVTVMIWQYAL